MIELDANQPLFELVQQYPEVLTIMDELGFHAIKKPGMLQTAGRYVTIPKGAKMKKISYETVQQAFLAQGYELKDK